jgi:NAD(P)-dependent dehydrogenase (short-subunit alcohol dehydrogenase family)
MKKNNTVCIVTGGSNGNGLGIVKSLIANGVFVISVDKRPIRSSIKSVHFIGDVLDNFLIESVFKKAISLKAKSYYLINNAGITLPESGENTQQWDKTIAVNLTAPYLWSKSFRKAVIQNKITDGGIINIGSLATTFGFPDNPAYQASKSGILGLTRSFAYDLGSYGIRVNCVSPGYIFTNMTKLSYLNPKKRHERSRQTLMGRWGKPSDIGSAVSFLCSNDSAYITGINLPVDGGWSCKGLIVD